MCRLVAHAELVSRVEMEHIQGCGVSCMTEASSSSSVVTGEGVGWAGRAMLLCQPSPAALLCSHRTGGGGLCVFFSQPHPHCGLPSQTLTLFPITSPSTLSPDLDSHGVRFKARWMESFISPMIVVMLRSYSQVHWEKK